MKKMNRTTSSLVALLALVLTGCAAGPDFVAPMPPQANRFTREPVTLAQAQTFSPDSQVAHDWWAAYGSPELNQRVARALANNPTIEVALANLKIAQASVTAQRGFFYPTVQAGFSVSQQNVGQSVSSPLASNASVYSFQSAQLSVGFVPDLFGGNRRQVESLLANQEVQAYQLDALRTTLASNVVATALQEASLEAQIQLTKQAIALATEQLQHVRGMHAHGYLSAIDVAQQENALTQIQQALPVLQKQWQQTRNLMAVLCGHTTDQELPSLSLDTVQLPARLPAAIPSQTIAQRPDVRAAQAMVHASSAQVGVAQANRLPQFQISAILGGGATTLAQMFSPDNTFWSLGASIAQPIFSGGTLLARKRAAEAALDASKAQYRSTVLTAFQNVADTLYALASDGKVLEIASASQAANRRTLMLTQSQFAQGYSARPAVLASQQADLQSQVNYQAAYAIYLGDTVALYQALGGGFKSEAP